LCIWFKILKDLHFAGKLYVNERQILDSRDGEKKDRSFLYVNERQILDSRDGEKKDRSFLGCEDVQSVEVS
jgi:hypothetical protein